MERTYDIFEKRPEGLIWHAAVVGLDDAIAALKHLAAKTPHECRLVHLPTNTVIARINSGTRETSE